MKSSAYPPLLHRQPPYINCPPPPFLKENLESPPTMFFQKFSTSSINMGVHTMTPQSNFTLTSPISIQLS